MGQMAPSTGVARSSETLYEEKPWQRYTARLKESPNWDEFTDALR